MSPTPGRGNPRASRDVLTRREREELRPSVERLAGLGRTYKEIAAALSTPQVPLNSRQVRGIQYKYGIPSGAGAGRKAGVPDKSGADSGNAVRFAALEAARAKIRELIEPWVDDAWTDQQMSDGLNAAGVPTLSGDGAWTAGRVESLRRKVGLRSKNTKNIIKPRFAPPDGHDAHCNTCDAPVEYDWTGKAILHDRLTRMVVGAVYVTGRCEGSKEAVVCRPLRGYWGMAA